MSNFFYEFHLKKLALSHLTSADPGAEINLCQNWRVID